MTGMNTYYVTIEQWGIKMREHMNTQERKSCIGGAILTTLIKKKRTR